MQCMRRVSTRRLLQCASTDSLHLRSYAALTNVSAAQPLSNRCTYTYSPLLFAQQSLGLSIRRGLCTTRGTIIDEEEIQEYMQLTDAEVAKIVDKSGCSTHFVGNGVNHNLVEGRLKPLKEYLGLTIAELKKLVVSFHVVDYLHDSLVNEKLEPLKRYLDLTDGELKKIVLGFSPVLGYNHDSVVKKLKLQQECLGYTDEEKRAAVIAQAMVLGYGNIEQKWALMNSGFAEEEGDQKLAALRRLGPRGLGVGLARLQDRLADLEALLGRAPKASEWFQRLVMYTQAKWENALAKHARE